jgi:sugar phosphate isomerase/epimerase
LHKYLAPLIVLILLLSVSCKGEPKKAKEAAEIEMTQDAVEKRFGGLALYTLRDAMGENPTETLKKVAEIGYKNIEAAGYDNGLFYGMAPADFKATLEEFDLNPVSTHQGGVTFDNADAMIDHVKAAGFKYFVVPVPPMGMFKVDQQTNTLSMEGTAQELAEILDTIGKKCSEAGLELLYHNHDFELIENEAGVVVLDYLLENCDPEFVNFQMDLYWMTKAGADPIAYFEKYPGRFKEWHVKDMDEQGRFAPVGKGSIDFKRILAQKELAGMQYYFVEQDQTYDGLEPLEAIKISKAGIEEVGFK